MQVLVMLFYGLSGHLVNSVKTTMKCLVVYEISNENITLRRTL